MSTYFTEEQSVEAVNERVDANINPRLKFVMASLVKHLHAFTKEVELTQDELDQAIRFLTAAGHLCTEERQEFILLSDVLGLSMLVDAINNRRPSGATENTVLGPFHVKGAPWLRMGIPSVWMRKVKAAISKAGWWIWTVIRLKAPVSTHGQITPMVLRYSATGYSTEME
nr:dioxygenase [Aliamphritea spongicola]